MGSLADQNKYVLSALVWTNGQNHWQWDGAVVTALEFQYLLCSRHHLKKFTCIYLFDPRNVLKRKHLISIIPILKMKKWTLRFGNLPNATQLVIRGAGLEPRQSGSSAHAPEQCRV